MKKHAGRYQATGAQPNQYHQPHYLGNYKMLEQVKKSNIEKLIDSVESDTELKEKFRECGLSNLYLLGEHANGHSIEKGKSNVLFGFYADIFWMTKTKKQADTRSCFDN